MRESILVPPRDAMRLWLALPAVAMSLGWGLRGYIGGGPLGAMIPGAMTALVLAALLRQFRHAAWLAACGALGIGIGGQMTYGQTVGLSLRPETFWWAMLGFALKGGAWGLAGGAIFGAGLLRDRPGWSARGFASALAAMLAATWAGWRFINVPKLVYFSDPINKPREELWAGLLAGSVAFLLLAARGPHRRIPWRFAAWAGLAGAAGFALGAALQSWGRGLGSLQWLDWWKGMEFTFGAGLGLGFGLAAWLSRNDLQSDPEPPRAGAAPVARSLFFAAAAAALVIGMEYRLPVRFNYSVAAALALAAALRSELLARHLAVTVTVAAFVLDLAGNKPLISGAAGWALTAAAGIASALWVSATRAPRTMSLYLMWAAVAVSLVKTALPPGHWSPGHALTEAVFLVLAVACTRWIRALPVSPPLPSGPPAVAS